MNEQPIITEKQVQQAVDYLRDTAKEAAAARANRRYLEEFRKSRKALIMKDHVDLPVSAQEREAYASDEYQKHLRAMQMAIELDTKLSFLREASQAKIDAWQTMSANYRAIKL